MPKCYIFRKLSQFMDKIMSIGIHNEGRKLSIMGEIMLSFAIEMKLTTVKVGQPHMFYMHQQF